MVHIERNPSRRALLVFTLLLPVFFGILGVLRWRAGSTSAAGWLWAVGLVVFVFLLLVPPARRSVYLGWMFATYPIAWVVSHVALAAVYFLVATPVGIVMRAVGRDPMQRRFDKGVSSYWVPRRPTRDTSRYFRQF